MKKFTVFIMGVLIGMISYRYHYAKEFLIGMIMVVILQKVYGVFKETVFVLGIRKKVRLFFAFVEHTLSEPFIWVIPFACSIFLGGYIEEWFAIFTIQIDDASQVTFTGIGGLIRIIMFIVSLFALCITYWDFTSERVYEKTVREINYWYEMKMVDKKLESKK